MTKTLSIRLDEDTEKALDYLIKRESDNTLINLNISEYIRLLIMKEATRLSYKRQQKN